MRLIIFIIASVLCFSVSFAENKESNVNVVLEIETEVPFVPFGDPSLGIENFLEKGFIRVIEQSEVGMPKYAALNEAMQKVRTQIWHIIVNSYVSDGLTIRQAIEAAPPFYDYKVKDEELEVYNSMSVEEQKEFVQAKGKEKKYDFERYLDVIKDCGGGKSTGRFYDAVEKIGYVCREVQLADFTNAVIGEKVNIFEQVVPRESYIPLENFNIKYDGILVDAMEVAYLPSFFFRLTGPEGKDVFSGVITQKRIYFAKDIEEAKRIFINHGARKVLSVKASAKDGDVGVSVTNSEADRVFSAVKKSQDLPFVIMYNINNYEPAEEVSPENAEETADPEEKNIEENTAPIGE